MFKGRKTGVFWRGLILFGMSITVLFFSAWPRSSIFGWGFLAPLIFGSVVFMFIGLYMMKSGVVEEESTKP
jgi:hypothetical protein